MGCVPSSPRDFAACARCGYCNAACPTYAVLGWESASPRGRLRAAAEGWLDPGSIGRRYDCTLCGRCGQVCPVDYDLPSLWHRLREEAAHAPDRPAFLDRLSRSVAMEHNVFALPNEERAEWVAFMPDAPSHGLVLPHAQVLYYVGCVSSFSPAVQSIPQAFVRLLAAAGVDFALAGGEEWCCGFPLQVAGLPAEAEALRRQNLEMLAQVGAHTVVFTCPSCLRQWREHYAPAGVELLHAAEFLEELVANRKLKLGPLSLRVAYHDPCDLGRGCGVYEAPRKLLAAIPGLELTELPENRYEGLCCGGGGDFEMQDPAAAGEVAADLAREILETGATIAATACPQCKRMLQEGFSRLDRTFQTMDLAELLYKSWVEEDKHGGG